MKITRIGPSFPLLTASTLGGGGGSVTPSVGSGLVPVANGSNGWAWGSNVQLISSNGSNYLAGPFVNFASGTNVTFAVSSNTLTINSSGSGASLPWFNVKDYGATGDGTTDDRASVNLAIAALNTAGGGVLYFPAAVGYLCSAGLTAITVPAIVMGDGFKSKVICSSATANLFTSSSNEVHYRDLYLDNSHATPSAGAAILASSGNLARYTNLFIGDFWIGIDHQAGIGWSTDHVYIESVRKYGIRVANSAAPDNGDWTIANTLISDAAARSADAAIRIESSGGGKISNLKVNGDPATGYNHAIDLAVAASVDTSLLQITNSSLENVRGDGLHGTTSGGTSKWGFIVLTNVQVALYSNNTGKAVNLVATTASDFHDVIVTDCLFVTNGTARTAMQFTNCDEVTIGTLSLDGFNGTHTLTTSTNTVDYTGGVASVAVTGTPSSGQVPTATSATAATWQTPSGAPTGAAGGDLSGTYPNPSVVDDSHSHTGATLPTNRGEVLVSDTPAGSPLVFADLLQNEAQTDLLFAD